MKNSFTLFGLLAFCFGLLAFQPLAWVPVALDSRVSVLLPTPPQEAPMSPPVKMLYVKDTVGTYIITTVPLEVDFQGNDRKTYYDSVIKGTMEGSKGQLEGGKLEGRSTFKVGNYDGIDFAVSFVRSDNQQKVLIFMHSLLVDKKAYSLQFIPTDNSEKAEAQCKRFFDSFTLH